MKETIDAIYKSLIALSLNTRLVKKSGAEIPLVDALTTQGGLNPGMKRDMSRLLESSAYIREYPARFLENIENTWQLAPERAEEKWIAPLPSIIENAIFSLELSNMFGEQLALCRGAFMRAEEGDGQPRFKFALSQKDFPGGIIVPVIEDKLITDLRIYRHIRDKNSFVLGHQVSSRAVAATS